MPIGIQLYTVRDQTGDDAFRDTLRALAALGFDGVEFAWKYGGMAPEELAEFLGSVGLTCCGMHVKLPELLDPQHAIYAYARATRCPFVTTSLAGREAEWGTPQVHLRDYDVASGLVCDVGDGCLDVKRVLAQARELGTRWLIFEQDRFPVSALESSRVCIERLKRAGG